MSNIKNWEDIVKKEARGINDFDLGEVHEVEPEIVVTKKGVVDKDYILNNDNVLYPK
jgi:hypothetical protein